MSDDMVCPLEGDFDEAPSCFQSATRRARKAHTCGECDETIPPGAQYEVASGVWDGQASTFKTCLSKAGGPCMKGLSPAAKQRLFDRRTAWLEAEAAER
jgi:hypothetical protein